MNNHLLLFSVGQVGILFQIIGSLLLLRQAFIARKFGGPELGLLALGYQNEVSMEALGPMVFSLMREIKGQFGKQLPGFAFLFLGMVCQLVGDLIAF